MNYTEMTVCEPSDDLHGGQRGVAVHNPALALAEILSKLHLLDHSIAVPDNHDDVVR